MNDEQRCFDAAKSTLTGERKINQDRCLLLAYPNTALLALGDGLGGHPRGEVAAQLLMDVCETMFRHVEKPIADPEYFMLQCIGKAHSSILRFGRRQDPQVMPRTTAVLAVIQDGIAHWAHVGDSRLYLLRDGEIAARTRDHAQVRFVRESATHEPRPRTSLTRCLGGMLQPPMTTCGPPTPLQPGDILMLCSDGLWGQLPEDQLTSGLIGNTASLEVRLKALVERAAAERNSDNVSAVAIDWMTPASEQQTAPAQPGAQDDPELDQAIENLQKLVEKSRENLN